MNKKTKALALCGIAAAMGVGVAAVSGFSGNARGLNIIAANHESTHTLKEKAYEAPGIGKEGFKPYWLCSECCNSSVNDARYDFENKNQNVTINDIVIPALTASSEAEVPSNDLITTINKSKFKYVDQGVNGVDGKEGDSTPVYIKDSGKTALFFSRSGKTGDAIDATDNTNCSEFRFSLPSDYSKIKTFSFSYRILDYGEGIWAGGTGESEPASWHSMIQLKDNTYIGKEVSFNADDKWHTMNLDVEEWGKSDVTTNLTDIIFKFVDLRGHIMISGLNIEKALSVTLKNVNADGTTSTANLFEGQLPEDPTMEGKRFIGWYDEEGNKVTGVSSSITTLVARWSIEKYTDYNQTRAWTNEQKDYGLVDGADEYWMCRSDSDIELDIKDPNRYPYVAGAQGYYPSANAVGASVGLVLTPFDFSKVSSARFTIGFSTDVGGFSLNGVDCGVQKKKDFYNYEIEVKGKTATVTNNDGNKTYSVELTDEMYNGEKGIEIKTVNTPWRWMLVTKIVIGDCDYVETCKSIESELDDTPSIGGIEKATLYKTLRSYFTSCENESYPISEKMSNWLSKVPETVLESTDSEDGRYLVSTDNVFFRKSKYDSVFADGADKLGKPAPCTLDSGSYIGIVTNASKVNAWFTLFERDFSKYSRVEFAMGFGGNDGESTPKYALGKLDTDASLIEDPNYIGQGVGTKSGVIGNGWGNADELKITISAGKISFKGTVSGIDKTLDLDNDIYTGKTGLSISFTGVIYEYIAVTPLIGYHL